MPHMRGDSPGVGADDRRGGSVRPPRRSTLPQARRATAGASRAAPASPRRAAAAAGVSADQAAVLGVRHAEVVLAHQRERADARGSAPNGSSRLEPRKYLLRLQRRPAAPTGTSPRRPRPGSSQNAGQVPQRCTLSWSIWPPRRSSRLDRRARTPRRAPPTGLSSSCPAGARRLLPSARRRPAAPLPPRASAPGTLGSRLAARCVEVARWPRGEQSFATVRQIDYVWIPLRDGTRLAARIWLPDDAEADPVPAILEAVPYRLSDGTATRDVAHPPLLGRRTATPACASTCAAAATRTASSLDEYAPQEQDDLLEVIAWIAAQPWCSGGVGMTGISWGGFNSLQVAARRPPALKAIITLMSTDDRYADDVHYKGGCVLGTDLLHWSTCMLHWQCQPPHEVGGRRALARALASSASRPTRPGSTPGSRTSAATPTGSTARSARTTPPSRSAVYAVGGWTDGYTNAVLRLLEGLRGPRKGLIGPWSHAFPHYASPGPAIGFLQEALRWWDHWLKGIDTGIMDEPMLRVWMQELACRRRRWMRRGPGTLGRRGRRGRRRASRPRRCGWTPTACCATPRAPRARTPRRPRRTARTAAACASAARSCAASTPAPGAPRASRATGRPTSEPPRASRCASPRRRSPSALEILGLPAARRCASRATGRWPWSPCASTTSRPTACSRLVTQQILNLTHRDESRDARAPSSPAATTPSTVALDAIAHAFPRRPPAARRRLADYWPWAWPSPEPVTLTRGRRGESSLVLPVRPPRRTTPTLPAVRRRRVVPRRPRRDDRRRRARRPRATPGTSSTGRHHVDVPLRRRRQRGPAQRLGDARSGTASATASREGDPLSARVDVRRGVASSCAATRVVSTSSTHGEMTCDATTFFVVDERHRRRGRRRRRARGLREDRGATRRRRGPRLRARRAACTSARTSSRPAASGTPSSNGEELGCEAIQFFAGSPRTWAPTVYKEEDAARFREARAASPIRFVVIHTIYLINLASANEDFYEKSVASLRRRRGRRGAARRRRHRHPRRLAPGRRVRRRPRARAGRRCGRALDESRGLRRSASCSRTPPAPAAPWASTSTSSAP